MAEVRENFDVYYGACSGCDHLLIYFRHCTLWKADRSPACRAVMMALDALDLNITEVDVNMDKGEHRSPEMIMVYFYLISIVYVFKHNVAHH